MIRLVKPSSVTRGDLVRFDGILYRITGIMRSRDAVLFNCYPADVPMGKMENVSMYVERAGKVEKIVGRRG